MRHNKAQRLVQLRFILLLSLTNFREFKKIALKVDQINRRWTNPGNTPTFASIDVDKFDQFHLGGDPAVLAVYIHGSLTTFITICINIWKFNNAKRAQTYFSKKIIFLKIHPFYKQMVEVSKRKNFVTRSYEKLKSQMLSKSCLSKNAVSTL